MARTFPPDLVQTQRERTRTYEALARTPFRTVLRRRLQLLSCRIGSHPYWSAGRSAADRTELLRQARTAESQERRTA
ncbi:hypothetical protein CG740_34955 [Streptomyces sp. CB01201]|uniref:hypothetical protein n=1 Tax=Streptomyces sp. CB01201 TaxID=2020324 RepID=UPI000C273A54|nr:hypothetical protein [Streptomyces sp. CB01201]PJM98638.1 hypothetical protein CG740_34955 [Streptomyces sp. CB01201]